MIQRVVSSTPMAITLVREGYPVAQGVSSARAAPVAHDRTHETDRGQFAMQQVFKLLVYTLGAALLLVGCGGGDDADTESTATTSTAASPTTTMPPSASHATGTSVMATVRSGSGEGTGDGSPAADTTAVASQTTDEEPATATADSNATATEAVVETPTELADATATEVSDGPIPEPTEPDPDLSAVDAALMRVLLTDDDLPDGWEADEAAGPAEADNTDGEELCAVEGFPDEEFATGQVSALYFHESDENLLVLLQKVWAFDDDRAASAFAYWQNASDCGEWIEDEETTYTIESVTDPGLGGESFAVRITFDAVDEGPAQGDYTFVRSGDVLMLIAYIGTGSADFTVLADPIETANERLQEVAAELGDE